MNLPLPEGVGPAERAERAIAAHGLRISAAATLADLARDYAIFTHGPFFTHGRLDVDPAADHVAKHPDPEIAVLPVDFGRRLFRGLDPRLGQPGPPVNWAATLLFTPHAYWPALYDHLRCCGWADRRRGTYGRAVAQELAIVDFLALDKLAVLPARLPTVRIWAFGVDGTAAHVQLSARHPVLPDDMPAVVHLPLLADTRTLGAAILSGNPRPFRVVESEDPFAR